MDGKEWRWEDGYKFYTVRELSDMLEAMKPGDVAYFKAFTSGYDYRVGICLMKDGYYKVSTKNLVMRFNSWELIGTAILEPHCGETKLDAYICVYVWVLEKKYNSSCDMLISWAGD